MSYIHYVLYTLYTFNTSSHLTHANPNNYLVTFHTQLHRQIGSVLLQFFIYITVTLTTMQLHNSRLTDGTDY